MPKTKYYLLILFTCLLMFFICQQVFALEVGIEYGNEAGFGTQDIRVTIAQIIRISIGILGIIVVILVIISGIFFMISGGEPEKQEKAKKILISALIGLVIILAAYFLASFILSTVIEATGQPGGEENPNRYIPPPTPPSCTGMIPANATFCPEPNATGLTADIQRQLVPSCSGDPTKCEYICPMDYNIVNGNCVNGDPLLPFDYQAFYSFTTGANALPSGLFDGIVYQSNLTPDPNPSVINNGYLNLDGSHFVRINNFSIGPSFTAIARVKSATVNWNIDGWIISTDNANGFLIHSNSGNTSWNGYLYDINGNRDSYVGVGGDTPNAPITDWHTYGLQYDNDTKIAKMIFDGQVVKTKTFTPVINRGSTNRNIIIDIGHDTFTVANGAQPRFGKGQIDWVYIYNRAIY